MKIYSLILFFSGLICSVSYSQNYITVEYAYYSDGTTNLYELVTDGKHSQWTLTKSEEAANIGLSEKDMFFYKNMLDSTIYFQDNVFNKVFQVKDTLFKMTWKLTGISKLLIEYECYEATTEFRGRTYSAYFTTDLNYSDGPWKFNGLPGLILEVKSDDNLFHYVARKVSKSNGFKDFVDLKKMNFISWSDFCINHIKAYDNLIKQAKTSRGLSSDTKITLKEIRKEIIYPKIQIGDGFTF